MLLSTVSSVSWINDLVSVPVESIPPRAEARPPLSVEETAGQVRYGGRARKCGTSMETTTLTKEEGAPRRLLHSLTRGGVVTSAAPDLRSANPVRPLVRAALCLFAAGLNPHPQGEYPPDAPDFRIPGSGYYSPRAPRPIGR
jgi:hypothetical protein